MNSFRCVIMLFNVNNYEIILELLALVATFKKKDIYNLKRIFQIIKTKIWHAFNKIFPLPLRTAVTCVVCLL